MMLVSLQRTRCVGVTSAVTCLVGHHHTLDRARLLKRLGALRPATLAGTLQTL